MSGRGAGSDFVEALARGLDVLRCFTPSRPVMALADVATAAGLARPTARRMLLTLEEVGMVRSVRGGYELTPRVLRLGLAYVAAQGLWDVARPHLEALVRRTGESSSLTQLDGSDIVYVGRVAVPKIVALRVQIGTRFPAAATSQGKVLLAALPPATLDEALAQPSRSGLVPYRAAGPDDLRAELIQVRARGWALADEELAPGIRSIAAPVRDQDGVVRAAMNINVHAAETSTERLLADHLPVLLRVVGDVSADWALWQSRPRAAAASAPAQTPDPSAKGVTVPS
ncbi:IclR family transcriptional regulator C-terminal domain-containing protein [Promicromonospora vindobonensis]|uniref:IclR family transcriptional regulator C-terminal domain-containing protein n=1 Tax=Promicromonospora vindobonensis TaxID=195748 RepID=A0ABW5VTJ8_9MICO